MLQSRRKLQFSFADIETPAQARETWREGVDIGLLIEKVMRQIAFLKHSAILGAISFGVLGAAWLAVRMPVYSASTEALISNTTLQLSGQDAVVTQLLVENTLLQSQILLVRSNVVMEQTVQRIGQERISALLPQPHVFNRMKSALRGLLPDSATVMKTAASDGRAETQALALALKANVKVTRIGGSQILSVSASGSSPDAAVTLANEVTRSFLAQMREINALVTTSGAFRDRIKALGPTAQVIGDAVPPTGKDGPRTILVMVLGPLIGACLGFGIGLIMAAFSRRIWSGAQLTALTQAEFFGMIRQSSYLKTTAVRTGHLSSVPASASLPVIEPANQPTSLAMALRRIRVAVLERRRSKPSVIGVTSLEQGNGKTTVSMGLALLLAGEGKQVLLVDAGVAKQDLTKSLALPDGPGLQQVLGDPSLFPDAVHQGVRSRLDVLSAGDDMGDIDSIWPNLARAIEENRSKIYEWVILDLPPMHLTADIRAASTILDDFVLVAVKGATRSEDLSQALEALGPPRSKLLGSLLIDTEIVPAPLRQMPGRLWRGILSSSLLKSAQATPPVRKRTASAQPAPPKESVR